ncbi:Hypothetical predicted protein [Cloeon dipterum]|uniref:Uncharacterized protein n=1 Tax=Cloeon dipterum TaxID=197152 RepID=A0A8S1BTI9_9INSE|nr:Hypothetical predicted protein [Cloeon dipterum]
MNFRFREFHKIIEVPANRIQNSAPLVPDCSYYNRISNLATLSALCTEQLNDFGKVTSVVASAIWSLFPLLVTCEAPESGFG